MSLLLSRLTVVTAVTLPLTFEVIERPQSSIPAATLEFSAQPSDVTRPASPPSNWAPLSWELEVYETQIKLKNQESVRIEYYGYRIDIPPTVPLVLDADQGKYQTNDQILDSYVLPFSSDIPYVLLPTVPWILEADQARYQTQDQLLDGISWIPEIQDFYPTLGDPLYLDHEQEGEYSLRRNQEAVRVEYSGFRLDIPPSNSWLLEADQGRYVSNDFGEFNVLAYSTDIPYVLVQTLPLVLDADQGRYQSSDQILDGFTWAPETLDFYPQTAPWFVDNEQEGQFWNRKLIESVRIEYTGYRVDITSDSSNLFLDSEPARFTINDQLLDALIVPLGPAVPYAQPPSNWFGLSGYEYDEAVYTHNKVTQGALFGFSAFGEQPEQLTGSTLPFVLDSDEGQFFRERNKEAVRIEYTGYRVFFFIPTNPWVLDTEPSRYKSQDFGDDFVFLYSPPNYVVILSTVPWVLDSTEGEQFRRSIRESVRIQYNGYRFDTQNRTNPTQGWDWFLDTREVPKARYYDIAEQSYSAYNPVPILIPPTPPTPPFCPFVCETPTVVGFSGEIGIGLVVTSEVDNQPNFTKESGTIVGFSPESGAVVVYSTEHPVTCNCGCAH